MTLSLNPASLKRYYELIRLFYKYGRGDLVEDVPHAEKARPEAADKPEAPPKAEELAADLERLGPTFIKLGQLLSTRPDIIPAAYSDALERLQDKVETFPGEEAAEIVSSEIGVRVSKAFSEFDMTPIGSASLSQVHRAVTRSGKEVVVKVQRPGVREIVANDLQALAEVASFLESNTKMGPRYQFVQLIEELRRSLIRELDYNIEASNLTAMAEILKDFDRISVPLPLEDYSSSRVLTMELIRGQKITKYSPVVLQEIDGEGLADDLFRCYLHQILVAGMFHADPHPGNVFLTEEKHITLLDLGMVARVGTKLQDGLLKLLGAIAEEDGDRVAEIAESMGEPTPHYDSIAFRSQLARLVESQAGASLEQLETGRLLLDVQKIAAETGLRSPPELSMLGKALLNLDRVGRTLSPTFDPNASIRRNLGIIAQKRMRDSLTPSHFLDVLIETKEFVQKMPVRLSSILDLVATNQLRVKVDSIDENLVISTLQKIANRITLGLIIAALLVGTTLLMSIETDFTIFGYPGLAMIFFIAAILSAGALSWQILRHDRPDDDPTDIKKK